MKNLVIYTSNRRMRLEFYKRTDFCKHGKACQLCCWQWKGHIDMNGRPRYHLTDKTKLQRLIRVYASRYMYTIRYGHTDLNVLHTCDNPACVNYNHLYAGTQQQNVQDREKRNRTSRGETHPSAKLKNEDIFHIFALREQGYMMKEIADLYGVTDHTISVLLRGLSWKHLLLGIDSCE